MARDDYPLPSYAAYIWIAGDEVHIQFPPTVGTKSHTVKFPNTANGLLILLDALRQRGREGKLVIGTRGEPTQYAVERALAGDRKYNEWLRHMQATKDVTEKERQESEAFLAELGL